MMFEKGAPRTKSVMVRLTDVERGYLVEAAGRKGVSVAEFVRSIMRQHLAPKKKGR